MPTTEVNFDGLVGPTHNYAGLSTGNIASMSNRSAVSNPREAALQGLAKMKKLADLGLHQAILPPHDRPSIEALHALGFRSLSDKTALQMAAQQAPELLVACSSASNMWVANAATVAPSSDTADHRVHFTPANLISKFHRSIEPAQTTRTLRAIFHQRDLFAVHDPVPGGQLLGDEGAANHTRLAPRHAVRGLHFFVYGHSAFHSTDVLHHPHRFPARQALEASLAVSRNHQIDAAALIFAQQHPDAIDAGVFHNDVISVGNENVFFYHESAFVDTPRVLGELQRAFARLHDGTELIAIKAPTDRIPLADAVRSYIFNSQLITISPGRMLLIAPSDCQEVDSVRTFIDEIVSQANTPLREVRYVDLKQSMRNGGGPACLRLRVVLTAEQQAALPPTVFLTDSNYPTLVALIKKHYRDHLTPADLADPELLAESREALDQLTQVLGLGNIYSFQTER